MSDSPNCISLDGLTANVQVARALIDEYNIELSTVNERISRLDEKNAEAEKDLIEDLRIREKLELQQLAAEFQSQRAPLEDEKRSLEAKINGAKGAIAPIRKLPAEILGSIFREVVRHGIPPWLLGTVSKSWRITCLTTPSLWSNIHVGKLDHPRGSHSRWVVNGEPRYTSGNRMFCRTLDELADIAEKSGAVPLDVLIDSRPTEDQDEVLKGLLGEPYSSRISSMRIPILNPRSKEAMAGWTIGRLPLLRNLDCPSLQVPIIELILSQTSQLHTLTVWLELSSALLRHPAWTSLRVLHLGYRTRATDFNDIVSRLSLVNEISGVPSPWPNESTPNVTLEHLKSIELSCLPRYLARLRLPRLERLYWSKTSVSSRYSTYLDVEPYWSLSFPSVIYFEAHSSGDGFESVLKYLPNVHTVFIDPVKIIDRDAWTLGLLKSLASTENMLCPRVRRLTVGNSSSRISTSKTSANPIIKRLIKSRVELGIPLEHLEIWWTRRSGKDAENIQYIG